MEVTSLSWGQFQQLVKLDPSASKTAENADIALAVAADLGIPISPKGIKGSSIKGWYFTGNKAFNVRQPLTR